MSMLDAASGAGNDPGAWRERETARLLEACRQVLDDCRRRGADQALATASTADGLAVGVRRGNVESMARTRESSLALTTYIAGGRGDASSGDFDAGSLAVTAEKACAIARNTESDPCNGLVDPQAHPATVPELDLWHPWALSPPAAVALAREVEAAGRDADDRIGNCDGARVGSSARIRVMADSRGFVDVQHSTLHSLSAGFIAGTGEAMQKGRWFDVARNPAVLADAATVGANAAREAVQRLGARTLPTCRCPVLLLPEVAAGVVQNFLSAIRGDVIQRRASFLVDAVGRRLFPAHVDIGEQPWLAQGLGSRHVDDEGAVTVPSPIVEDGVLLRYLLDAYSARKLGLSGTANAGGAANVVVRPGSDDLPALLRMMGRGLVVAGLMGEGVSLASGDYSRGAWGFWVEDGRIAFPVEGVTIASNLREMFAALEAVGRDPDMRLRNRTGAWLIGRMTVAGS